MKWALNVVLAFCLIVGFSGNASAGRACRSVSGHCHSKGSAGGGAPICPYSAICPICANAGTASLAPSDKIIVLWVDGARNPDEAWLAEVRADRPPIPPPRADTGFLNLS